MGCGVLLGHGVWAALAGGRWCWLVAGGRCRMVGGCGCCCVALLGHGVGYVTVVGRVVCLIDVDLDVSVVISGGSAVVSGGYVRCL